MKISEKLATKQRDVWNAPPVSIAFLGDSVTQGCFEIYQDENGSIETVFEQNAGYPHDVAKILAFLYPKVPIQIINAGLSGDNAPHALKRLNRDVISHNPDLVIICFGLNDSMVGLDFLPAYVTALDQMMSELITQNIEVIFMTPNMMNTDISCYLKEDWIREYAEQTCQVQTEGIMEQFLSAAKHICKKRGIPVCDCYEKWNTLYQGGVPITELLANKTNHPARPMHWLFAMSLVETMFRSSN